MTFLDLTGVQKQFGDDRGRPGLRPRGRARRVRLVPGPVRLRQDDDPADDRRVRDPDRRHDHRRRRRTSRSKPPNQRNVGMVFQSYALFPNMTVADNIGFGLQRPQAPEGGHRPSGSASCSR